LSNFRFFLGNGIVLGLMFNAGSSWRAAPAPASSSACSSGTGSWPWWHALPRRFK